MLDFGIKLQALSRFCLVFEGSCLPAILDINRVSQWWMRAGEGPAYVTRKGWGLVIMVTLNIMGQQQCSGQLNIVTGVMTAAQVSWYLKWSTRSTADGGSRKARKVRHRRAPACEIIKPVRQQAGQLSSVVRSHAILGWQSGPGPASLACCNISKVGA